MTILATLILTIALAGQVAGAKSADADAEKKADQDARVKEAGLDPDVLNWLIKFEQQKQGRLDKLRKKGAPKSQIDKVIEEGPTVDFIAFPIEVGAIGGLGDFFLIKVFNVVDDQNFLASVDDLQVKGAQSATRRPPPAPRQDVWIRGFDTRKMTDGQRFKCDDLVRVTGTKRYETVAGSSKQVVMIERFDVDPYYAELKKRGELAHDPGAPAKPAKAELTDAEKADKNEKAAEGKIKLAKSLLKAGNTDGYRKALKEAVEKYPDTKAAAEAKKLLK